MTGPEPAAPADDAAWLTLAVYSEARGETQDGKAAVAQVIMNRTRRKPPFFSDGTIRGTLLAPMQFSGFWCDYVGGKYVRVAHTQAEAAARAADLYARARADRVTWGLCAAPAVAVLAGSYRGGVGFRQLGPDALLYDNLKVSQPAWATPDKLVCRIGAHSFFRP
jgi:spore germination cell wall hydrolase CwlJ-like protein